MGHPDIVASPLMSGISAPGHAPQVWYACEPARAMPFSAAW